VVQAMRMRIMDLDPVVDLKATVPPGPSADDEIRWRSQRYIKDYLRTIASIDDSVGGDAAARAVSGRGGCRVGVR